jgi:predicted ATPase
VAFVVGIPIRTETPIPALVAFLKNKQMLLVFDSCERVIDGIAPLTEEIIKAAPGVHILATSREPLRATNERVQHLSPLQFPSPAEKLKATQALSYPAIQLFAERASESRDDFELNDANAPLVAEICRKLDGIALAIELAAARVDTLDVGKIAELLDGGSRLHLPGRRTAPKRHQTLQATLDWSYELLSDAERTALRRLAVFVGGFAMESASAILAEPTSGVGQIVNLIASLVAKSLVSAELGGDFVRYRLLETTRAYALEKMTENNEWNDLSRRHAAYYCGMLQRPVASDRADGTPSVASADIGNLRAALEWAFSSAGDATLGVALVAAVSPVFLERSLVKECENWTEKAITRLTVSDRGTNRELELLTILGVSMPITKGNTAETKSALMRALDVAKSLKDYRYQIRILDALCVFHLRLAEYKTAFELAGEIEAAIPTACDLDTMQSADWLLGVASHFLGNHNQARSYSTTALNYPPLSRRAGILRMGGEPRLHARCAIARTLWLEGHFGQALSEGRRTVDEARTSEHTVSLCIALAWITPIFLWIGELETAEQYIALLIDKTDEYSLTPYQAIAHGLRGELLVRRHQLPAGIELLSYSVASLQKVGHEMFITEFTSVLAEACAASGRVRRSVKIIEEALARIDRTGETLYLPEALRIKGEILASADLPDLTTAEKDFQLSLDWARRQPALSWELRTATSLANLWRRQGREAEARALLSPVYARFEKFAAPDLWAAGSLLNRLA